MFKRGLKHFEPALRVVCDMVITVLGKLTPQLLNDRDQLPRTVLEAASRGETLCDWCLQGVEDSHRERKGRASTKTLKSKDGVKVHACACVRVCVCVCDIKSEWCRGRYVCVRVCDIESDRCVSVCVRVWH